MGGFNGDRFEASFQVAEDADTVWASLVREQEGQPLWLQAFPSFDKAHIADILETRPAEFIRALKTAEPCKDTDITLSLSPTEGGTQVDFVQSAFPAYVSAARETFEIGGNQIAADLALYLSRGVNACRHAMPWAFVGFTTDEVDTGLMVREVMPGSYGERIGLAAGDLLVTIGPAPVFTQLCLQALLRVYSPGSDLAASWVRGEELMQGSASL